MKKFYLFCFAFYSIISQAQLGGTSTASISADLPTITPPSPTVASLMKFEEVPVNNYTGTPEISIPLFSVPTLSKDLSVELALKYHPSSIAIKEVASYTGLGWNLTGGGTISRTVRGLPDEIYKPGTTNGAADSRIGIYNDDVEFPNHFFQVLPLLGSGGTPAQLEMIGDFLWGAFEEGLFDTEHDLYQYNFMGHTGRFYVTYDGAFLTPVKLDNDNSIQITLSYTDKTINSFTLYDDKGYKYIFDVKEITSETGDTNTVPFGSPSYGSLNPTVPITYVSAFQLSQVRDNNDKEIINITYQNAQESTQDVSSSLNVFKQPTKQNEIEALLDPYGNYNYEIWGLLPRTAVSTRNLSVVTKKMLEIQVTNKAKIGFTLGFDRTDTNMRNANAAKLTDMTVKDWAGNVVKNIRFTYDYATIDDASFGQNDNSVSRLVLMDVSEWNNTNSKTISYACHYKNQQITSNGVGSDYWGYYKAFGPGKETDPDNCTTGVLTQLDLPTKGRIVFDFGPNTYSYIGNTAITDFSIFVPNTPTLIPINMNPGQGIGEVPITLTPGSPDLSGFMTVSGDEGGNFRLINTTNSDIEVLDSFGFSNFNDGSSSLENFKLNNGWNYKVQYRRSNTAAASVAYVYHFKGQINTNFNKWFYGGGIRINKISYFSDDSETPSKEKHFNYNFFSESDRSSGALTYAKPIFKYLQSRQLYTPTNVGVNLGAPQLTTYTTFNNLLVLRTKGSDVGYQNVTVWETGNGKSEYTYTSPIDNPETGFTISYPFIPPVNVDHKRGLLTNEKHYSQSGSTYKIVAETLYDYPITEMNENTVRIGIRGVNEGGGCPGAQNYDDFFYFKYCADPANNCSPMGWQALCNAYSYLGFRDIYEAYGWPQLKQKINKEYFYPQPNDQRILTTTETFDYYYQNKRLAKSTITNSVGEVLTTEYTYDNNSAGRNRIGEIKRIQTKRGSALLDKKEINYSNNLWGTANTAFLPSTVTIAKGNTAAETRLNFVKYDEYSNPIEAKLENGTPVVYIWGYDNSLPVAIIENITYSSISSTLINDVKTASVQNTSYTESNLLSKLTALRAGLPASAMVTTITHKPLVGVSTMTDPKGVKTSYSYDEFNRLKTTTDDDNYIMSENEYNYKP